MAGLIQEDLRLTPAEAKARAERVLAFGIEWAKSHGLVESGHHAVLLRGHVADGPDIRAVLAGRVT